MSSTVLTRYNYSTDLLIFFDFLAKQKNSAYFGKTPKDFTLADLDTLTNRHFERYLDYLNGYYSRDNVFLKNKDRGKARKFSAVRSLFKYLYNNNLLKENVTTKVSMPKLREKEIIRLSDGEVTDMLDTLENAEAFASDKMNAYNNNNTKVRDNAIIALFAGTGIRVSECVGLNVSDINFHNKTFTVTRKGDKQSILYFSDEIAEFLLEYVEFRAARIAEKEPEPEDASAFFLSLQNKRISVRAVQNIVKKYAKIVAPLKNITPHKLRSTYGTALYRATGDIYVVAEVLGHKDINTTKKHYAALGEDIKKAASDKVKLRKDNTDF